MVAAVTAALVLGACSSGDAAEDDDLGVQPIEDSEPPTDDGSEEPVPDPDDDAAEEPEPEPEPEEVDPFAIPDEIDEAYVDLVMNELLAVHTTTLHDVLAREPGNDLEDADLERLRAVLAGQHRAHIGENFFRYAADATSREAFLRVQELGEIRWATRRIMEFDANCIVAIGYYDLREVSQAPYAEDEYSMASLSRAPQDDEEVLAHNPTPWRIHDMKQVIDADGDPVPEADWHRLNYSSVLARTCDEEGDG